MNMSSKGGENLEYHKTHQMLQRLAIKNPLVMVTKILNNIKFSLKEFCRHTGHVYDSIVPIPADIDAKPTRVQSGLPGCPDKDKGKIEKAIKTTV
jgi:hypothetical protein